MVYQLLTVLTFLQVQYYKPCLVLSDLLFLLSISDRICLLYLFPTNLPTLSAQFCSDGCDHFTNSIASANSISASLFWQIFQCQRLYVMVLQVCQVLPVLCNFARLHTSANSVWFCQVCQFCQLSLVLSGLLISLSCYYTCRFSSQILYDLSPTISF